MNRLGILALLLVVLGASAALMLHWQRGKQAEAFRTQVARGETLYSEHCARCHQAEGWGQEPYLPALRQAADVLADSDRLVRVIVTGKFDRAGDIDGHPIPFMPPANALTASGIADVIAYITSSWGYEPVLVAPERIAALRTE